MLREREQQAQRKAQQAKKCDAHPSCEDMAKLLNAQASRKRKLSQEERDKLPLSELKKLWEEEEKEKGAADEASKMEKADD